MSYTTLLKIYKTKTSEIETFSNAWGTSPLLWNYLVNTYIKKYKSINELMFIGEKHEIDDFWRLFKDETIPFHLRACLLFTYDYAYCPSDKIQDMAEYCFQTYETINDPNKVNNWKDIGETLKNIKLDKRAIGVGMQQSQSDLWEEKLAHVKMYSIFKLEDKHD
jgi:hypothetical protein